MNMSDDMRAETPLLSFPYLLSHYPAIRWPEFGEGTDSSDSELFVE